MQIIVHLRFLILYRIFGRKAIKKFRTLKINGFNANNLNFRFSNIDTRGKRRQSRVYEKSLKKIAKSGGNLRQAVKEVKMLFFCLFFCGRLPE